ncbi:alpha/beta fold hydrolase [Aeromicrobium fastidiosum]|uniref:Alpha/beta fold hydrolase n=1 Tax=Aeromicrobium fastidiosum TaxID=52699 RepID=A0A641AQJ7_9ACTN|nr:alpha/beta fold hydrolase [Aeromicrobium fastidiosum]KAA1379787.1 alpha/beta fold hydrolase [Aeromicrobium fastidiosum]MBP2389278.1 3-oxoadipate enol-lactonase/4-carboxymuconolactone decarboxylase [Aeromicrobium fastidiosum]
MPVPQITAVRLGGSPALPLLVLGPSLGTSARTLWSAAAAHLSDAFEVVAWDLPGHGSNPIVARPFTMSELAAGVLAMIDDMVAERGDVDTSFVYAGNSVGGAVGLHLLLDSPARVDAAVLLCTGAKIGDAAAWHDRAATVRASGTSAVVEGSAARWFAPGFLEREPARGSALLQALRDTDREGYAQACEALAGHDVRSRLGRVGTPVLAVAGSDDVPTPTETLQEIAAGVRDGRLVVLDGIAHLAPAEAPAEVARLVRAHVRGEADAATLAPPSALDPRSTSLVTVTALVAGGHHDELATHLRTARAHGLSTEELDHLLQIVVLSGVPATSDSIRVARDVLAEIDREESA